MEISANNLAYWLRYSDSFDERTVEVLRQIKEGELRKGVPTGRRAKDGRFFVAFLISMKCATFDPKTLDVFITEKGEEALLFFKEERR